MKYSLSLLLTVCFVGGHASADMFFTPSTDQIQSLTYINPAPAAAGPTFTGVAADLWEYDPADGYVHSVADYADTLDTARNYRGGPLTAAGWSETLIGDDVNLNLSRYSGYRLPLANDDDDLWYTRLYLATSSDSYWSSWTPLPPGMQRVLTLNFAGVDGLRNVTALGFAAGRYLDRFEGKPPNGRTFPASAVPLPGAVLLGLLGLAVAGLKLRTSA